MSGERGFSEIDSTLLVSIMSRLAEGDRAALVHLRDSFRSELVKTVRAIARSRGARLGPDDVEDLLTDAAMVIAGLAHAWKPDGAPPWFWAKGRIAREVDRHLGQWSDELDDARYCQKEAPAAASGFERDVAEVFAGLAESRPDVALFREALQCVGSPRDQLVFVEHGLQVAMGDPSPAVTVARLYEMNPAAVRQQTRRIRLRLKDLAASDERFAPLVKVTMVA